jgi:hypothetical protein
MTGQSNDEKSSLMLQRIDAMMREIQALREMVLALREQPELLHGQVTQKLPGLRGQAAPLESDYGSDFYKGGAPVRGTGCAAH